MQKDFEIRDPIHGMISFSSLEREIINLPAFQRLRRIRQLSWTDYVYPGAMHTRFQHTIGVMHTASRAFDAIVNDKKNRDILSSELSVTDGDITRQRVIIRLAALAHDLGHSPFSHAGENLFPYRSKRGPKKRHKHEEYSIAILRNNIFPAIASHPEITAPNIRIEEVISLIDRTPATTFSALWNDIIAGLIDADRMDYLLRDSYYCGVRYGHFEIDRLMNTICICNDNEGNLNIGIREDGLHAAEGLFIARYMMFHNVYFHKTRSVYDFHYASALKEMLGPKGEFPKPTSPHDIDEYLKWDDWKVQGLLTEGKGGAHGEILSNRNHYRLVNWTNESFENLVTQETQFDNFKRSVTAIKGIDHYVWEEKKSFSSDLSVAVDKGGKVSVRPLLELSGVLKSLRPLNQKRLYVKSSEVENARAKLKNLRIR